MGIRPRSSKSSISPTVAAPVAAEVVIEIEASPINQYDLLLIAGGYGTDARPRLDPLMVSIDISDCPIDRRLEPASDNRGKGSYSSLQETAGNSLESVDFVGSAK